MNHVDKFIKVLEIEDDEDEYKWEPRKPYSRTLKQWWMLLIYKIKYIKPESNYGYSCHVCGSDHDSDWPSSTLLEMSKPQYSSYASYEFGIMGHDWEEEHQCNKCGSLFGFSNSSY